jgi:hypothetical protein
VVPGHGDLGGPQVLTGVRDYLRELRDETWRRRDTAMAEDEIAAEVQALLIERHPEWAGQEWIERGVGCLCTEHSDRPRIGPDVAVHTASDADVVQTNERQSPPSIDRC